MPFIKTKTITDLSHTPPLLTICPLKVEKPTLSTSIPLTSASFALKSPTIPVIPSCPTSTAPLMNSKSLYALRWGIESSFRNLKYTVGPSSFHSKKVEHILQEIFARLTIYNFAELITQSVVIRQKSRKYFYLINFSAAMHIGRQVFRGNVSPPVAEALTSQYISPVRPFRSLPRKLAPKGVVSFLYRAA